MNKMVVLYLSTHVIELLVFRLVVAPAYETAAAGAK